MFFTLPTSAFAQSGGFPRIEPDPQAIEFYRIGQRGYSWADLAEVSLWASGNATAANVEKIRAVAATLKNSPELPASGREKADFILGFMHKNILKSYSMSQTRIDTLLSNGRYNCVSSAVLYMILCGSMGIDTVGVMTKDHAFVTVRIDGSDIDVETTNPYGFDPGNRKDFHDQFGKLTGFAYVPARNYRDRQTISQIELVSLIMNNMVADIENRNRYAEAVPLAVDRFALLAGNYSTTGAVVHSSELIFEDPRENLMDRLLNYGASLLKAGKEEDAVRWAVTASGKYPDAGRWQELIVAGAENRIIKLRRANQLTEARNFLESQKTLLSPAHYAQLDTSLVDAELIAAANRSHSAAEGDAIVNAIEQARASGRIADRRAIEMRTYAVQKTAMALCAAPGRDWRAAINYIENVIARFGANRELEQTLQTYRGNVAADYHNRFAAEWNRKNFNEAERILNEGLAELPDNRQLLSDRETLNKNRY